MINDPETPLTVLSVAYPFAPVGADAVGGAEQILSLLDRALVAAGHTSLVVACEGSQTAGRLFPVPLVDHGPVRASQRRFSTERLKAAIHRALLLHRVDIIHMHGLDFYEYDLPASIPMLVTLHLPIAWYEMERLARLQPRVQLCCVSESQRRSCPSELGEVVVIENGVELPPWPPQACAKEDFGLVLGRICPEKNIHAALEAGDQAGMRVLVAGRVFPYPEHQAYFQDRLTPLLNRRGSVQHEFLGPVGAPERTELLSRARCLLHPTLAPETSSLVAMEALAAGTPVIAYRSGALPDIVGHGITGFLVDDMQEMADAMRRVGTLSPQACRRAAEQRFRAGQMTARYLHLYRTMVRQADRDKAYA